MLIYLINIFLIVFLGVLLIPKGYNKLYNIIISIQWILLSGLRHWSIGADTYNYYSSFIKVQLTSWNILFDNFKRFKTVKEVKGNGFEMIPNQKGVYFLKKTIK